MHKKKNNAKFATKQKSKTMTAIDIRKELAYEITQIPDSEILLFRALNYVKNLVNSYKQNPETAIASEDDEMKTYEKSLSKKQRDAAYEFVADIKKRIADVENAHKTGSTFGRRAEDFLSELKKEAI